MSLCFYRNSETDQIIELVRQVRNKVYKEKGNLTSIDSVYKQRSGHVILNEYGQYDWGYYVLAQMKDGSIMYPSQLIKSGEAIHPAIN